MKPTETINPITWNIIIWFSFDLSTKLYLLLLFFSFAGLQWKANCWPSFRNLMNINSQTNSFNIQIFLLLNYGRLISHWIHGGCKKLIVMKINAKKLIFFMKKKLICCSRFWYIRLLKVYAKLGLYILDQVRARHTTFKGEILLIICNI